MSLGTLLSHSSLDWAVNEYQVGRKWQWVQLVRCAEMSTVLYVPHQVEQVAGVGLTLSPLLAAVAKMAVTSSKHIFCALTALTLFTPGGNPSHALQPDMWIIWDVNHLRFFEMWIIWHVNYLVCELFEMWIIWHVNYLRCELLKMWIIWHVNYFTCELLDMWSISTIATTNCHAKTLMCRQFGFFFTHAKWCFEIISWGFKCRPLKCKELKKSPTWSCVSLQRPTTTSGWKLQIFETNH